MTRNADISSKILINHAQNNEPAYKSVDTLKQEVYTHIVLVQICLLSYAHTLTDSTIYMT